MKEEFYDLFAFGVMLQNYDDAGKVDNSTLGDSENTLLEPLDDWALGVLYKEKYAIKHISTMKKKNTIIRWVF